MINIANEVVETTFEKVEYYCNSYIIFEGFYESNLWNSDSLYYDTMDDRSEGYLKPNEEYDILDWDGYRREVGKDVASLLCEFGKSRIVNDINFTRISSPKYYNYETDKFIAEVDVNIENLKKYCLDDNKENFGKYLKEKYTSCSGYISFIPNNVPEFIDRINEEDERCTSIMLDYYFLTCIYEDKDVVKCINEERYDTTYHYRLYEYARENIYNYREVIEVK